MPTPSSSHRFCVAPMMDWTDRHCRFFMRQLSRHARLYTEMVTTGALIHGDTERFLRFHPHENPLALQLGGSNPHELAECTALAAGWGYAEVNLNAGCPSDRVQNNKIGACLMAEPVLVRDCLLAMREASDIPVTLKTRIGIDDMDSDQQLVDFVGTVSGSGIDTLILHARIALLQGLSPKQNREVPPLNYSRAELIKRTFPELDIVVNGGITSLEQCAELLGTFDGVMLGREAYQNPWLMHDVDASLYGMENPVTSRQEALERLYPYIDRELENGTALHHMSRHLLGLFHGQPGGKKFRRLLSENAWKPGAGLHTLQAAVAQTRPNRTREFAC